MKVKLKEDFDWNGNDSKYSKGDILEVQELMGFNFNYARYYHNGEYDTMDWIPKSICELI